MGEVNTAPLTQCLQNGCNRTTFERQNIIGQQKVE
jgi:hypothetical protein